MSETVPPTNRLTRGSLLSDIGSQATIHEATLGNTPIIIKRARSGQLDSIKAEADFLKEHSGMERVTLCEELGIHLPGWKVKTRLVKSLNIEGDQLMSNEIALERAQGETLLDGSENHNRHLPYKFQMAGVMGYLEMLKHLQEVEGVALDSNIDKELFIDFDLAEQTLIVTKVDCFPLKSEERGKGSLQDEPPEKWKGNLDGRYYKQKHAVASQIADHLVMMFGEGEKNSPLYRIINDLGINFKLGDFLDPPTMYSFMQKSLQEVDWLDLGMVCDDNTRYAHMLMKKGISPAEYYLGHVQPEAAKLFIAINGGHAFPIAGVVHRELKDGRFEFNSYNPYLVKSLQDRTCTWEGSRILIDPKAVSQTMEIGDFITTTGA